MNQWMVLFTKEWLEAKRNFKLLWIPLVFILLGIMQPVSSYFLPDILEKAGDLPEGAVIDIPLPTSAEVIVSTLSQFNQIGVLILTLAFMGIVAGERNSGVQEMILVKPVAFGFYITAKWLTAVVLGLFSFFLGMLAALYYTSLLIGDVTIVDFSKGILVYSIWLLFLITALIFFSSFIKNSGIVAFLTIGLAIVLSTLSSLLSNWLSWSPGAIAGHAYAIIQTGSAMDGFGTSMVVVFVLIVLLLVGAVYLFKASRN